MKIERISESGFITYTSEGKTKCIKPDDLIPANVRSLVEKHPHKDRRSPEAKQAYLDRLEAQRIADEPTQEEVQRRDKIQQLRDEIRNTRPPQSTPELAARIMKLEQIWGLRDIED